VTGEIAIRNSYYGETSFYVMDNYSQLDPLIPLSFDQKGTQSALTGWIECHDADHFEAHLKLITKI
jgi:3-oxoacyl-[acyl-carrier-protein] synthase-1